MSSANTASPDISEPDLDETRLAAARGPGRAIARLARQLEHGLGSVDLTLPQYRVLALLADGSAASSHLAERLAVSPPSVTGVVDGLVARGLVIRKPHPTDRRRLDLDLTPEGRTLLVEADESVNARLDAIAAHLDRSDARTAMTSLKAWHTGLDGYRDAVREAKSANADK
jgi:DNA-binding MarR family transcriptional regulator